jgi:uncharacterized protein YndB with AHSA1/START domain
MPDDERDTNTIQIERTLDAPPEKIWELWTTPDGISAWWAPDGFTTAVRKLELEPGGELVYTMTASAPEQVEFMRSAGMPLSTESRKRFTEVAPPRRLAYSSLADFIPGVEPYWSLTVVDLAPEGTRTHVVMTMEPMHDQVWTERLVAGRRTELENLAALIAER